MLLTQANCDSPKPEVARGACSLKRVSEYSGIAASTVPSGGTRKGERHLGDRECEASGVQGARSGTGHRSLGISTPDPVFFLSQSLTRGLMGRLGQRRADQFLLAS